MAVRSIENKCTDQGHGIQVGHQPPWIFQLLEWNILPNGLTMITTMTAIVMQPPTNLLSCAALSASTAPFLALSTKS